jgi:hypothetical protein
MLMFPLAVVPLTYTTSFLFGTDTQAQIATFFFHFLLGGLGSTTVFILRAVGATCAIGDQLLWWFRLSPVYCVADAILWSSSGVALIGTVRGSFAPDATGKLAECGAVPLDLWALENLGGDALMLALNFAVNLFILLLVEARLCEGCRKLSCRAIPPAKMMRMDEDVEAEEERVCA